MLSLPMELNEPVVVSVPVLLKLASPEVFRAALAVTDDLASGQCHPRELWPDQHDQDQLLQTHPASFRFVRCQFLTRVEKLLLLSVRFQFQQSHQSLEMVLFIGAGGLGLELTARSHILIP